ncbi:MAG: aspartate aminotransferase family protein [Deltaproteobacteria bacterium]|nr:aspartate aminotransferase family protein [Deltaproteobacteria bacterium]
MKSSVSAVEAREEQRAYAEHVNPRWAALLDILQMNVSYDRCVGSELYTTGGRRILDFNSGYCVHNAGHNHPAIKQAIKEEIDRDGPAMLQSHLSDLAGVLAERLCERASGRLNKAFFASSGSEGIETVIKFARAHTGRAGLLAAQGSFHGLTCGALSLMSDDFWRNGFGPLLPEVDTVAFGDLDDLGARLKTERYAALILEPIQVEGGIRIPSPEYLRQAEALCRRYGTLFVLDEVQTGMYRTGPFLAAHHFGLEPDMVVMAKALSGGLIPVAAVLMSDEVNGSVYSSLKRAIVHTSTYSENALAMRAGLATLDVLEAERAGERAVRTGNWLRSRLTARLSGYEMVRDIRGIGMLTGVEFQPSKKLRLRLPFEAFARIHPAMFGQVLVMRLFRDKSMLTQICGNNFMVLKIAPALTVSEEQAEGFVNALGEMVELMHSSVSFWSEPLGMVRRIIRSV